MADSNLNFDYLKTAIKIENNEENEQSAVLDTNSSKLVAYDSSETVVNLTKVCRTNLSENEEKPTLQSDSLEIATTSNNTPNIKLEIKNEEKEIYDKDMKMEVYSKQLKKIKNKRNINMNTPLNDIRQQIENIKKDELQKQMALTQTEDLASAKYPYVIKTVVPSMPFDLYNRKYNPNMDQKYVTPPFNVIYYSPITRQLLEVTAVSRSSSECSSADEDTDYQNPYTCDYYFSVSAHTDDNKIGVIENELKEENWMRSSVEYQHEFANNAQNQISYRTSNSELGKYLL